MKRSTTLVYTASGDRVTGKRQWASPGRVLVGELEWHQPPTGENLLEREPRRVAIVGRWTSNGQLYTTCESLRNCAAGSHPILISAWDTNSPPQSANVSNTSSVLSGLTELSQYTGNTSGTYPEDAAWRWERRLDQGHPKDVLAPSWNNRWGCRLPLSL